jgi:hypothetical protein
MESKLVLSGMCIVCNVMREFPLLAGDGYCKICSVVVWKQSISTSLIL